MSRTAKNGILQVDKQKPVEGMAEVRARYIFACIYDGCLTYILGRRDYLLLYHRTRSPTLKSRKDPLNVGERKLGSLENSITMPSWGNFFLFFHLLVIDELVTIQEFTDSMEIIYKM